ncbi:Ptpn13 [Acrasis kona]|uniref:Ptpn13 n=1 Tax=Acrasis kona TaxID=1008807 RepID=A0AAW2Z5C4_9EUKA
MGISHSSELAINAEYNLPKRNSSRQSPLELKEVLLFVKDYCVLMEFNRYEPDLGRHRQYTSLLLSTLKELIPNKIQREPARHMLSGILNNEYDVRVLRYKYILPVLKEGCTRRIYENELSKIERICDEQGKQYLFDHYLERLYKADLARLRKNGSVY